MYKGEVLYDLWPWEMTPTEWVSLDDAAAHLRRGYVTGPGRTALSPALASATRTRKKKADWARPKCFQCTTVQHTVHYNVHFPSPVEQWKFYSNSKFTCILFENKLVLYVMLWVVSSPPPFTDTLDRSSRAILYSLQLEGSSRCINILFQRCNVVGYRATVYNATVR